ncbi:DUF1127 domain-containing protein [Variovorax sp. JS1663]|uniref:DUF1127 domain-containing protein n=1 Tax=Variovorax sp. JS1663 TaxID=1851577 RepID=UPI000B348F9C|nr:DUF1127 domain-containing protein [Variovorax sp. JS1663]OUM02146.1 hypothetical protein A8M77_12220 [Variovorax sp. JS1663]
MESMMLKLLKALADRAARSKARRRARQQALQLKGMSEHELLDLGIGRSEVPALVQSSRAR